MTVRLVREEEWELARDARLAALAESPSAFLITLAEEEHSSEEEWRDRVRPTDQRAWFAEVGDDGFHGIAVVALVEPDPELAWIFSMWVDPAHRRAGIGRRLVQAAVDWAAAQGARRIELEVSEKMEPAHRLYVACGFVPTGKKRELPAHADAMAIRMARSTEG
ncbi:MAG TPA: GNAT family N-acetyltransferase [Gaiellaceae bacterium]|nr:GNAT family N-acetyltransferase [Gaiellaceae bacterium]